MDKYYVCHGKIITPSSIQLIKGVFNQTSNTLFISKWIINGKFEKFELYMYILPLNHPIAIPIFLSVYILFSQKLKQTKHKTPILSKANKSLSIQTKLELYSSQSIS